MLALLIAAPPLAEGKANKVAARHYHSGHSLFKKGDHAAALVQFKKAHGLDPRPEMLFNIGLCHHKLGQQREALVSYGRYLREKPDAKNYEKVRLTVLELAEKFRTRHTAALAALEQRLAAGKAAAPVMSGQPEPPPAGDPSKPAPPGGEPPPDGAATPPPDGEPSGGDEPGAPADEPPAEPPAAQPPVGEPPATEPAEPPTGEASGSDPAPQSQPAPPPPALAAPDGSPDAVAQRGVVLRLQIGPSGDVGGGTATEQLGTGFQLGIQAGFQFRLGRRHGLAPELAFGYDDWGFEDDTVYVVNNTAIPIKGGVSMVTLGAGARYSLYLGRVDIWAAAHFGYGSATLTMVNANDSTARDEESESGFAFDLGLGAHYMILRYFGAGLHLKVNKAFLDSSETVSATGFSVGLSLLGKLPI